MKYPDYNEEFFLASYVFSIRTYDSALCFVIIFQYHYVFILHYAYMFN